jgi:hypothetical protein
MEKIVKLNYDRKVRYLYDKDTLECERLSDIVMDHYGEFLEPAHGWDMDSHRRFIKELRTCGLSVKKFPQPKKTVTNPKRKVRKTVKAPVETPEKKPTVKKPTVKKPTVKRKTFNAKAPVKKKSPATKKK